MIVKIETKTTVRSCISVLPAAGVARKIVRDGNMSSK